MELEVGRGGEDRGLRAINEGLSFSWTWPGLDCFKRSAVCLIHQREFSKQPTGEPELVGTSHTYRKHTLFKFFPGSIQVDKKVEHHRYDHGQNNEKVT